MSEYKNTRGWFIVIEGIDGSGKSTQVKGLQEFITNLGYLCTTVAEPTKYATGGLVRDALSGMTKRSQSELLSLFYADRVCHCENPVDGIKKLLEQNYIVLADRYYLSTCAYQGMDLGWEWILDMHLKNPAIIQPDITFLIKTPIKTAMSRINKARTSTEIFEKEEYLTKINDLYLEIFNKLSKEDKDHNYVDITDLVTIDGTIDGTDMVQDTRLLVQSFITSALVEYGVIDGTGWCYESLTPKH